MAHFALERLCPPDMHLLDKARKLGGHRYPNAVIRIQVPNTVSSRCRDYMTAHLLGARLCLADRTRGDSPRLRLVQMVSGDPAFVVGLSTTRNGWSVGTNDADLVGGVDLLGTC